MNEQTNGYKHHELTPQERVAIKVFLRDVEATQNQLRGAIRILMLARGIQGNAMLSPEGDYLIEQQPSGV